MPTKKLRLSRREALEYQAAVLRLQQTGVQVGRAGDFSQEATSRLEEYLRLEQIDPEAATIYDLPGVALAVVIPAKLMVRGGGILIAGAELTVPWDPMPLKLEEPENYAFFKRVINRLICNPPKLLYPYLTGKKSLYRSQREGVIVGMGCSSVPLQYGENAKVPITLSLWDEQDTESSFTLYAYVDRFFKEQYEREHAELLRRHRRIPLFSEEARLLPKVVVESHLTRWYRELERSPRVTPESRFANSIARQVVQFEPTEGGTAPG